MGAFLSQHSDAVLAILAILGTWFATVLARKGKREDTKIATGNQTFTQLRELGEARLAEINRLQTENAGLRAENERDRLAWEARWDRQMTRCRKVTDEAAGSIARLMQRAAPEDRTAAEATLRDVHSHLDADHA